MSSFWSKVFRQRAGPENQESKGASDSEASWNSTAVSTNLPSSHDHHHNQKHRPQVLPDFEFKSRKVAQLWDQFEHDGQDSTLTKFAEAFAPDLFPHLSLASGDTPLHRSQSSHHHHRTTSMGMSLDSHQLMAFYENNGHPVKIMRRLSKYLDKELHTIKEEMNEVFSQRQMRRPAGLVAVELLCRLSKFMPNRRVMEGLDLISSLVEIASYLSERYSAFMLSHLSSPTSPSSSAPSSPQPSPTKSKSPSRRMSFYSEHFFPVSSFPAASPSSSPSASPVSSPAASSSSASPSASPTSSSASSSFPSSPSSVSVGAYPYFPFPSPPHTRTTPPHHPQRTQHYLERMLYGCLTVLMQVVDIHQLWRSQPMPECRAGQMNKTPLAAMISHLLASFQYLLDPRQRPPNAAATCLSSLQQALLQTTLSLCGAVSSANPPMQSALLDQRAIVPLVFLMGWSPPVPVTVTVSATLPASTPLPSCERKSELMAHDEEPGAPQVASPASSPSATSTTTSDTLATPNPNPNPSPSQAQVELDYWFEVKLTCLLVLREMSFRQAAITKALQGIGGFANIAEFVLWTYANFSGLCNLTELQAALDTEEECEQQANQYADEQDRQLLASLEEKRLSHGESSVHLVNDPLMYSDIPPCDRLEQDLRRYQLHHLPVPPQWLWLKQQKEKEREREREQERSREMDEKETEMGMGSEMEMDGGMEIDSKDDGLPRRSSSFPSPSPN